MRLDPISLGIFFKLPIKDEFVDITKEYVEKYFVRNKAQYLHIIAKKWLRAPNRGKSQLPPTLHKSVFVEDISNMVIFLNRSMGNEDSGNFQEWMFLFINTICIDNQYIDWGEIISNNLHNQLT